jgi:CheY-like chemotaxis protein
MISDIGMPETDGFDLIRQIRERHPQAELKTIALTAYARKEDEQRALAAGFHCHLPKPLESAQLIEKVYELANGVTGKTE